MWRYGFAILLSILCIGQAVVFAQQREWSRVAYWVLASAINVVAAL